MTVTGWIRCARCNPAGWPVMLSVKGQPPETLLETSVTFRCAVCHGEVTFTADEAPQ